MSLTAPLPAPVLPPAPVATATRATADRIAAIDEQQRAAAALNIDASVMPQLAADLQQLNASLAQWPANVRPLLLKSLQDALVAESAAIQAWPVDRSSAPALLAFAATLQKAVGAAGAGLGQAQNALGPLRAAVDQSLSRLAADSQLLSDQLAADQSAMDALESQIEDDQDTVEFARANPVAYLLSGGVDIVSLLQTVTSLIATESSQQAAFQRLQGLMTQVQPLAALTGPLGALSTALQALSGGLVNLQTATAQVVNSLDAVALQKLLAPILAAQIETLVQDLKAANGVINEVLAGHRGAA